MHAIPLTVIGGYLGAGKTTLVDRLLRHTHGMRLAVLVNDFGALAIDAALIESRNAEVISLAGGCICCSFGADLVGALVELAKHPEPPDRLLVETSGVALPGAVARAAALVPGVRVDAIVVVTDAETVESRAADRYIGDTVARQLRDADLVVLNKADLVTPLDLARLDAWIAPLAPRARRIVAVRGEIPYSLLFDGIDREPASPSADASRTKDGYESASFACEGPVDLSRLARELAAPETGVVRAKAIACDIDGGCKALQVVGGRHAVTRIEAEDAAPVGLVCIGLRGKLDTRRIEHALRIATTGEVDPSRQADQPSSVACNGPMPSAP